MSILKTEHFTLSVHEKGDANAPRLAIVLPGRLESKDYVHIQSHLNQLADLGFHALAFDPPGSWESPGDIKEYTVSNYLAAVQDLIEYYDKPTLLVGHSLGGSIAILAGARNQLVIGLILLMTATMDRPTLDTEWHEKGFIRFDRDMPPGDRPGLNQQRYDLPYSFIRDVQNQPIRTTDALQRCVQPKLFVLGQYDTSALPDAVRKTYESALEPKQLIEVPSHHGYRYSSKGITQINRMISDFVATLKLQDN